MSISETKTFSTHWRDYFEVTKPRVVALMVFTAIVGMLLAPPDTTVMLIVVASVGIGLMAGAAAAINQLADQHADAKMSRTLDRPLVTGALSTKNVIMFAGFIGALGMGILLIWVNTLTALLTLFSLYGYAVIYTLYLKRATPLNIVIGGAAGATPPLLGWTAVTGHIDIDAILLFLIIFAWTPPHFWALALERKEEYEKVNIPMLPVTHGDAYTRLHIVFYTLLLVGTTFLPYVIEMSGLIYLTGVTILDIIFLYYVLRMYWEKSNKLAMPTFTYSIVYLMLLFAFLLVDKYADIFISGQIFF